MSNRNGRGSEGTVVVSRRLIRYHPTLRSRTLGQFDGGSMQPAAVKPQITIEDLAKIDVRVGTIVRVEDVAG